MASSVALRLKEVEEWSRLVSTKPSEVPKISSTLQNAKKSSIKAGSKEPNLEKMTKLVKQITRDVEQDWENLDRNQKELLTCMVYAAMNQLRLPVKDTIFTRMKWQFKFIAAKVKGEEKQIAIWKSSILGLYNAILDAVEKENKQYQRDLGIIMKEVTFDPNAGTLIDQENIRDSFRNLSSQAIREF